MEEAVKIIYKCRCMAAETEIDVPDRRTGTEIAVWLDMVRGNIAFDHRELSSHCQSTQMEYAKIPLDDNSQIGTPADKD